MEELRLDNLQDAIGYRFRDPTLLRMALTHSSYLNLHHADADCPDMNERLEFLGDAVLQLVVSERLYGLFPDCREGYLTQFRQHLVCQTTLARVARSISLGAYLYLDKGVNADLPSVLAGALEALFAAVYLDAGGLQQVTELILRILSGEIALCGAMRGGDYKTRLQRFVEQSGEEQLTYRVASEDGPPHARVFHVEARVNSNVVGRGTGGSKREAEQLAAKEALALFGFRDEEYIDRTPGQNDHAGSEDCNETTEGGTGRCI